MSIEMWETIRLLPYESGEVEIAHGVSACGDDGEVCTKYIRYYFVDDPSAIGIEVEKDCVMLSINGKTFYTDEVEDGREDRFPPVWYRPSGEAE